MAQIRITSPQAVGRVAITAIVPGIVTYHVYWDGRIENLFREQYRKDMRINTSISIMMKRDRSMKFALRVLNLQKCMERKTGLLNLSI